MVSKTDAGELTIQYMKIRSLYTYPTLTSLVLFKTMWFFQLKTEETKDVVLDF